MSRHRIAAVCLIFGLLSVPAASAAGGKFESRVRALRPNVPGLGLKVVGDYRQLELQNRTGGTVVVKGYDDEPYLRFDPNGVVERSALSPATYLNVDRFGAAPVPASAKPGARPSWRKVASGGTYTWFDHRIHLTVKRVPRELRNVKRPKKVFDWQIPLTAQGRSVQALGTLLWVPSSPSGGGGGFPVWIAVALGALALVGIAVLAMLRSGRRARGPQDEPDKKPASEAW